MFEKALVGEKRYWMFLGFLAAFIGLGFLLYLKQFFTGLGITGMSRDVSWGFYISQFTFLVGVAASAVMVVIPYYLHDFKKFGKITILGEFLAISSVIMCLLFIFVDMGQPMRVLNVILYPTPNSIMFWDMLVLNGYLFLNVIIGWTTLSAERNQIAPPSWVKPLIYISIPLAFSIHTVTAFLYAGLPGRHFWLTAIMAPRFLASAFAGGPALLIILSLIVRKVSKFDPDSEAIQALGKIVTYAMIANVFFFALEIFTAFYSQIPSHKHTFEELFGHSNLMPLMWLSVILAVVALVFLLTPSLRKNENTLIVAASCVFVSLWLDKGFGLVIGGFNPNPFERSTHYWPTFPEFFISIGVWSIGFFVLTMLYKIAVSVREEVKA
jgi:molybdopterin-containing oxidoreductase family membrane subunit